MNFYTDPIFGESIGIQGKEFNHFMQGDPNAGTVRQNGDFGSWETWRIELISGKSAYTIRHVLSGKYLSAAPAEWSALTL